MTQSELQKLSEEATPGSWSCADAGKVRFRTELDAKIVLAGRQAKDKGEVRTYKCSFCNGWHLTSMKLNREEPRSP